jgi:septum formation protein
VASDQLAPRPLILASASKIRATLLAQAGVAVAIEVAPIDESEVKRALKAEGATVSIVAETLAELKAQRVSRRHPDAFVIGVDSMLDCDGVWFDKPEDLAGAQATLRALSGKTHQLVSSVAVLSGGGRLWHHTEIAKLTMRPLSPHFIERYLEAAGEPILHSVGAYQLEGLGAQLFERIEGDYFTILGLPLLPLLGFLRTHGFVAT